MSNEKEEKRIVVLPDYLDGQTDEVKHSWRKWEALGRKIDSYPGRFQTIVHPKTGSVKTVDCKAPIGVMSKVLKEFGASKEDTEMVMSITTELQKLKTEKGRENARWSRYVFGKKSGDKSILGIRSVELLDLFGKFYSLEEVKKIIRKEWGFAVRQEAVRDFYNNNLDKIERKRAEYVLKGKETRLATDAGRLEVLSKLAWEFEEKFKKTQSIEISKELRAIIEQIRKEIKGEEIRLTVDGKIDIQATIQANKTLNELLQQLPINMIVIGLVAAKQGLNPASIMAALANSYYSKFNGFNNLGTKEEIELPGKFIKQYDWDKIKRLHNEHQFQDIEPISVIEEVKEEDKVIVLDTRDRMLEMLKQIKDTSEDKSK